MDRRSYLQYSLALSAGLLVPAGVVSLVGRQGVPGSAELAGFNGMIMGTSYSVRLGASPGAHNIPEPSDTRRKSASNVLAPDNQQLSALSEQVHSALLHVDQRMSTWRADSELSVFNRSPYKDWQKLSPDTIQVVENSMQVSRLTEGAFDASVGSLVDLWGFGANSNRTDAAFSFSKPSDHAVVHCLRNVSFDAIEIDSSRNAIRKAIPEMKLDLSGIAKGFAVDSVAESLNAHGINHYLVEVGGELRSSGQRSNNQDWRVAIEKPKTTSRDVLRVINLRNKAIATSGDYRNFHINAGQRYSHSIDPRDGRPVNHGLASVTVIAETAMLADAFSTALVIMGPDDAQTFAEQHQIAAHFVLKSPSGQLDEQFSPTFHGYLA